jgi:hypothetical protein
MPKVISTILLLLFMSIFVGSGIAAAQERPPVLAFYYAWFDENTWGSGQPADIPSQPYRSADPAAIDRRVGPVRSLAG